jgi:hypothetical protein
LDQFPLFCHDEFGVFAIALTNEVIVATGIIIIVKFRRKAADKGPNGGIADDVLSNIFLSLPHGACARYSRNLRYRRGGGYLVIFFLEEGAEFLVGVRNSLRFFSFLLS